MTGFDRNALLVSCSIVCMAAASPAAAQTKTFDIPAQAAQSAISTLGRQADVQIIAARKVTRNKRANAVRGNLTVEQALGTLLRGTGLTYRQTGSQTFIVVEGAGEGQPSPQSDPDPAPPPRADASPQGEVGDDGSASQEIVVTGTNIRGADPVGTKVLKFTRDQIDKAGIGTTQEFLRTLPQNFNQGAQDSYAYAAQGPAGADGSGDLTNGASVNIRGLGADSTLVLLNGRRMPPTGQGNFVDISLIPVSALARVEVLNDGASAIYGSDAIGGVVNFVLRDDFEGAETRLRAGTAQGGAEEVQASQALGAKWGSGHGLISYEYYEKWGLDSSERAATGGRNYLPAVSTIVPPTNRHSVFAMLEQELGRDLTFNATGMFARREFSRVAYPAPNRREDTAGSNRQIGLTGSLDWTVNENWKVTATGAFSRTNQRLAIVTNSAGRISNLASTSRHKIWSGDLQLNGDLFDLPGGAAKMALGAGFRREDFLGRTPPAINREVRSAYMEVLLPLVGSDNAVPGIDSLNVSLAGRYEDYSDFGDTFNPRVGVDWSPIADLKFRGTYSTSFRAPTLLEKSTDRNLPYFYAERDPFSAYPPNRFAPLGDSPVLILTGTDPNLKPETSTNWTLGFDFKPKAVSGLALSLSYYNIDFRNRIASPLAGYDSRDAVRLAAAGLVSPDTVLRGPSDAYIASITSAPNFMNFYADFQPLFGWPVLTPNDADVVIDLRTKNLARTTTDGLDLDLSYAFETRAGSFAFGVNGNYIFSFKNRNWSGAPANETVDTVFNPINLKVRAFVSWSNKSGWSANAFVNYADSYRYYSTYPVQGKIRSWTTVDLSVGYDTGERFSSTFLNNMRLQISATNLFNQSPPKIFGYSQVVGAANVPINYDATNANVIGRFVSIQLIKKF